MRKTPSKPSPARQPRAARRPAAKSKATKAPGREDGVQTRKQLLEVAGRLFAEQGYAGATSKEICEVAGTNVAAVNYHFGGKDGLYAAVLEEAHARLVSLELVTSATQGGADAGEILRMLLTQAIGQISQRDQGSWALRVLSRELMAPTALADRMITSQVLPKFKLISGTIARALGVPVTHPAVSRCVVSIIGPCAFLLIAAPELQKRVFPSLGLDPHNLVEHMVTFTLGGLAAVATNIKRTK